MGLEEFKTEGPRTFVSEEEEQDCVHILRGTAPNLSMVPDNIEIHKVEESQGVADIYGEEIVDMIACHDCSSVSQDFKTQLKVDKLEFRDSEWYDDFMVEALEAAQSVTEPDTTTTSDIEIPSESEDEDDEEEEFSSGLGSFVR